MKLRLFGAAFAALVTFNSANATVYNINEVINVASSVVGTLTTDGFIGSLTDPTHIVDWNLTVTANTVSGNLFGPSSGNNSTVTSLLGPALVASATDLTFNFVSLTASEFRIQSSNVSWLFEAYANPIFGQEFVTIDTIDFGTLGGTRNFSDSSVIGVATATSATPLPAALPLFAGGLGALGLLGWRRKRKQIA